MTTSAVTDKSTTMSSLFGAAGASAAKDGTGKTSEAQDRFLKLLVTQMRSQDPLNPMDNTQVTSQVAQISTVNGIEKLNETMGTLSSAYNASQSMQAASMIGRGVLAPGSELGLAGGTSTGGFDLAEAADRVTVLVQNAAGRVVRTLELGPQPGGTQAFNWDGAADDGSTANPGKYSFTVQATRAGDKVAAQALAYGKVDSVALDAQGLRLQSAGLGTLAMTDIKRIF